MIFWLAVDFIKVYCALLTWISSLKIKKVFYTLIVANENHRIKRIFLLLCHKLLLDIGTTLMNELERNFKWGFVVELVRLGLIDEIFWLNHWEVTASVLEIFIDLVSYHLIKVIRADLTVLVMVEGLFLVLHASTFFIVCRRVLCYPIKVVEVFFFPTFFRPVRPVYEFVGSS